MNEFRRCLEELDTAAVMALWDTIRPGQQPPKNEAEALIVLHYARTQAVSIAIKLRAYSHRWLCDRDLPSGLPDYLKPAAERIYPQIVEAVGVSVKAMSEAGIPLAKAVERAMSDAVAAAYADGNRNSDFIKARMDEARARVMRG